MSKLLRAAIAISTGVLSALAIWVTNSAAENRDPVRAAFQRPITIPFPAENPYTPEKAALGKALFFDPRLSGAKNMNCASCHNPSFGWEVPVKTAVGAMNAPLARQAPTILNAAWIHPFFWDGRAPTAEAQAKGPIEAAVEMNLPLEEAVKRLRDIPGYVKWFDYSFPDHGVTPETIVKAIATFERTVVSTQAPFDSWVEGDKNAISQSAKNGFRLFTGSAGCSRCHSGWNFTDNKFHDIGFSTTDRGRGELEPSEIKMQFAVKTPGLRDIAMRAPYMHNGELRTLKDVIAHYVGGGINRPSKSDLIKPIALSENEINDLIAFLRSLTGAKQVVTLPILPN